MAPNMRVDLKGLHRVVSKGHTYYYIRRGGPRIETRAELGTPEFHAAYNAAAAKLKPKVTGQVLDLIVQFKRSTEFTGLALRTQSDYTRHLTAIETKWGKVPLAALGDRRIRGDFKEWRDALAKKSLRQADYAWTVLQRVFSVAKDRGRISVNPCEKGGRLYEADRTDKLWTDEHVARFIEKAPAHLHLPLMLALWTGQRQGDLLRLTWAAYDGQFIRLRQSKGKRRVKIPVGSPLKAMLDKAKRVADVILTTTRKGAWTEDGFRASWGKACIDADIDDVTFHDFRGSAVTRLCEAGATVAEIASITGHSLADVEAILDAHYFSRTTTLAESGIAKLERRSVKPAVKPSTESNQENAIS
jgi:integrase